MLTNTGNDILTKANTNVTWEHTAEIVTMAMTTTHVNPGEWRAISFSIDQQTVN